jgi:hypothetical protein
MFYLRMSERCVSTSNRKALRALGVTFALVLISFPLFAQLSTGRISGGVTDQSGGAIAGVKD